mgnify:CR=1 FL=1
MDQAEQLRIIKANNQIRPTARVITVTSGKGGVGKSTTAINLSSCLGAMGQKVLTIDLDPQGNTTSGLGVEKDAAENTVYELLLGECEVEECLQKLEFEGVSLIPSNVNLAGAEIELIGIEDKEYILQKKIRKNKVNLKILNLII